jgi:hypothetical protein
VDEIVPERDTEPPPDGERLGRGGADAGRTRYLLDAIETLYQLSYGPAGTVQRSTGVA